MVAGFIKGNGNHDECAVRAEPRAVAEAILRVFHRRGLLTALQLRYA